MLCAYEGCTYVALSGEEYCGAHICRNSRCSRPRTNDSPYCEECAVMGRGRQYDPKEVYRTTYKVGK